VSAGTRVRRIDFSHVFNMERWKRRFRSEAQVAQEYERAGRTPDASVDDEPPVTAPYTGNNQGTGNPNSPGWAGWGGG
jgi:hypothetical protein